MIQDRLAKYTNVPGLFQIPKMIIEQPAVGKYVNNCYPFVSTLGGDAKSFVALHMSLQSLIKEFVDVRKEILKTILISAKLQLETKNQEEVMEGVLK